MSSNCKRAKTVYVAAGVVERVGCCYNRKLARLAARNFNGIG